MVKNSTGGSGSKGLARKHFAAKPTHLRLSQDIDEKYAHVTKMYGEMCEVICDDNISRKCFIRGKFRGKGKRSSFIKVGEVILVGTRSWSSDTTKCDLLEVYTAQEVMQLKNHPKVPSTFISMNVTEPTGFTSEDKPNGFEFTNIVKEQDMEDIMPSDINDKITNHKFVLDTSEEINIDEI
jgi:initiation factor 1A